MNYQGCLDAIYDIVDSVPETENIYKRRVAYKDAKDFENKYRTSTDDSYKGFQIYRSGLDTEFIAFNKKRHTHTFSIVGIIGIVEKETPTVYYSFDKLTEIMQNIYEELGKNLTLDGNCTDSGFPTMGVIDFDTKVGKLFWMGEITLEVFDDEIFTESIS